MLHELLMNLRMILHPYQDLKELLTYLCKLRKYLRANRNFMSSVLDFGDISRLLQLISRGVLCIKLSERGNT